MEAEVNKNGYASTKSIQHLQARLNEDKTVQAIDRLLDRIDTLEKAVDNLTTMMHQGPGLVAMTMDMADEGYRQANSNGVSIENRLGAALQIAEKLTAPSMVEKLDSFLSFADQAPGLVAMTMDMVDDGYRQANSNGVSIENRLGAALQIAEKLTAPAMVEKLDGLLVLSDQAPGLISMAMDVFDEEMRNLSANNIDVKALTGLAQNMSAAVGEANKMPDTKVSGIFSMLRTMKDPDRQKAIGFFMNVAKAFGQKM